MTYTDNLDQLDHGGHRYSTVSAHSTSEGRIAYQHCTCGLWRVQRFPPGDHFVTEAVAGAGAGVGYSNITGQAQPNPLWALSAG